MPSLDCIIGLAGVELESATRSRIIEVRARLGYRPCCIRCGNFRCRIKSSFTRTLKHTRQGDRMMLLHIRSHKYVCLRCGKYFNARISGVLPRKRSTESFRQEVYEKHHGGLSQSLLSHTHGVSHSTVERWYQDFVRKRIGELKGRHSPKILGIDEHFFTKKAGYATTLCDLQNHKVFDVILGRSDRSLSPRLEQIPERYRTKIVVMDLSETYRQIVTKQFPNALIVADRFHVIRLINHHFLKAWQLVDPLGRRNRGLLSLMRRHETKLSKEQKETLGRYLSSHPGLKEIYSFKQRLCAVLKRPINRRRSLRRALYEFHHMVEALKEFPMEPLRVLGQTLERWKTEIARMMRFRKSNGITEGFHTKMEMLSRRAFGFRNFQNYRSRVLAHCGWNGVFAVRN